MHDETDLPEHVRPTVSTGTRGRGVRRARGTCRARSEPTWGIWRVPDAELHVLPEDPAGKDVIELGYGTAYLSVARPPRRARGRDRQLCGPAGDGPPAGVTTDSR